MLRLVRELEKRGYSTWVDVEKMVGSTLDSMAEAVEGAALVLLGMSKGYKVGVSVLLAIGCISLSDPTS